MTTIAGRLAMLTMIGAAAAKIVAGSLASMAGLVDPARYPGAFPPWVHLAHVAVFGGAGVLLFLGSRVDVRVRYLGTLFFLLAASFSDRLIAAAASASPASAGTMIASTLVSLQPEAFIPFVAWRFVGEFPRVDAGARLRAAVAIGTVVSLVAGLGLFITNLVLNRGRDLWPAFGAILAPFSREPRDVSSFWQTLILLVLPAFAVMLCKIPMSARAERRRVGVFVSGLVGGAAPMMTLVVAEGLIEPFYSFMNQPVHRLWSGLVCYSMLLSIPFTTGYSVLVGRVMDLRLVVRKALRYAIARLTVMIALALPTVGVLLAIYERRDRTIAQLLVGPNALALVGASLLCLAVFRARSPLFSALDRHFFREQHDAREFLAAIADRARGAGNLADFAAFVGSELDRALHVERIALMMVDRPANSLISPLGDVEPLPLAGTLVTLLSGDTTPLDLEVADARSTLRRLSSGERDWVTRHNVRLLVPLIGTSGALVGAIALGPRRSEQPFSASDRLLLSAVGAAAALTLENRALRSTAASTASVDTHTDEAAVPSLQHALARRCQVCGLVHSPDQVTCRECNGRLVPAILPERLNDKFQLQRFIGAGGMGVVYLARDEGLRRSVALKTLPRLSVPHARRLRREARAMASLQHAHLATIYGLETSRNMPILVVEYFPGGTLADRLRRGPMSAAEVCRLGCELAEALEYLHGRKLLHRDVKPSNVGLTDEGVPKLLDFGLAMGLDRSLDALSTAADKTSRGGSSDSRDVTPSYVVAGTIAYLPPEAFQRQPPSVAFDLWGLGVTLYEALTGIHPFKRPTAYETVNAIMSREATSVLEIRPNCPTALGQLLADCLRLDSRLRPATAASLSARLRAVCPAAAGHRRPATN